MRTAVSCRGGSVLDEVISPFTVEVNEFVALACPFSYGEVCWRLMQLVGGQVAAPFIRVHASPSMVVLMPGRRKGSLLTIARKAGLATEIILQMLDKLGFEQTLRYQNMGMTQRMLFDLSIAWARQSKLVVYTSAGLDPLGFDKVSEAVSEHRGRCTAIDVTSTHSIQDRVLDPRYSRCILI